MQQGINSQSKQMAEQAERVKGMDVKYNINLAIKNQNELCEKEDYPYFAPKSGKCYKCKRNIYEQIGWAKIEYGRRRQVSLDSDELYRITGITAKQAKQELVTGCPHCNMSYCD